MRTYVCVSETATASSLMEGALIVISPSRSALRNTASEMSMRRSSEYSVEKFTWDAADAEDDDIDIAPSLILKNWVVWFYFFLHHKVKIGPGVIIGIVS